MSKLAPFYINIDKDSNGEISWSEFISFQLKSREILKDTWPFDLNDLRGEFADLDVDGDGKITKEEFVGVLLKFFSFLLSKKTERLRKIFLLVAEHGF